MSSTVKTARPNDLREIKNILSWMQDERMRLAHRPGASRILNDLRVAHTKLSFAFRGVSRFPSGTMSGPVTETLRDARQMKKDLEHKISSLPRVGYSSLSAVVASAEGITDDDTSGL